MTDYYYTVDNTEDCDDEISEEEIKALANIESMRNKLCNDSKLSNLFFHTFKVKAEEVELVPALLCNGGYLVYICDDIGYFIRIINENMLEIIVQ